MTNWNRYQEEVIDLMQTNERRKVEFKCEDGVSFEEACALLRIAWLNERYDNVIRESIDLDSIDWNKVEVDTPILVSNNGKVWYNRYFSHYANGDVFTWRNGRTSWSTPEEDIHRDRTTDWRYARIPVLDNQNSSPQLENENLEIDWSKIPTDTKILVSAPYPPYLKKWFKAYFAYYENGRMYAWYEGATSWSVRKTFENKGLVTDWEQVRLADSE